MKFIRNTHLHSREHLLADDLSKMLLEPHRFASYLGIAGLYEESDLRSLARRVLEKSDLDAKSRGKYFFGALRGLPKKIIWIKPKAGKKLRISKQKSK